MYVVFARKLNDGCVLLYVYSLHSPLDSYLYAYVC